MKIHLNALGLALVLAASLGAQNSTKRMVQEAFLSDPGPLDFVKGEGQEQFIAQSLCGDALVGLSTEGQPVPRLASSWKLVPGGMDLSLRSDARFTDGSPVTAGDVAWTFRAIQQDDHASPTKRSALGDLKVTGSGLRVSLRGSRPAARLLMELWRVPIAKTNHSDLGSGPFALLRSGTEWTFMARPDHYLHPQIPGLHFRLLPDDAGRLVALQKGWLSLGVPPPEPGLSAPTAMTELLQPTLAQMIVWAGPGVSPGALRALARWRRDAFPPSLMGHTYATARGLWPANLGFPGMEPAPGPEPCPATLDLAYTAGDGMSERLLQALSARAAKDGVALKLRPMEAGLFIDQLTKGKLTLGAITNVFDPNPWSVLGYVEPGGDLNFTNWSDAGVAPLLAQLATPKSPAWKELQSLWAKRPAAIPLLDLSSVLWVDRKLEVHPGPLGIYMATPGAAGWRWRE